MADDVIDALVKQLLAAVPGLPHDQAHAAAARIRQDWGGSTHYVKKAPATGKAFGLGTALAAGVPLTQAFADAGVSRATGYRYLKRRWRVLA